MQYKTDQEIFDHGLNHILKQGKASVDGEACKYRDTVGNSCIIGGMIGDEFYDESFEGKPIGILINYNTIFQRAMREFNIEIRFDSIGLLRDMQDCHDRAGVYEFDDFIPAFKRRMAKIAKDRGLEYTVKEVAL